MQIKYTEKNQEDADRIKPVIRDLADLQTFDHLPFRVGFLEKEL